MGYWESTMENLGLSDFWRHKKVFVTGATGLVGSNLVSRLLKYGANVSVLMWEKEIPTGTLTNETLKKIDVFSGDLCNKNDMSNAIISSKAQFIFHLGAQTIVGDAVSAPEDTFKTNILGTWNLLEALRLAKHEVSYCVIASSDKAYGNPKYIPYDEQHPLNGLSPYDVSKSCTDLLAQSYANTYGLPIGIARCGNIYGPGDLNWSRIVPGTLKSLLIDNTQPIIRSTGEQIRDYIFVEDVVNAYLLLAQVAPNLSQGIAYNFSTDKALTVMDIYDAICTVAVGKSIKPIILAQNNFEIEHQHLSSKKANFELNWEVEFNLQNSLEITVDWYKKFFEERSN